MSPRFMDVAGQEKKFRERLPVLLAGGECSLVGRLFRGKQGNRAALTKRTGEVRQKGGAKPRLDRGMQGEEGRPGGVGGGDKRKKTNGSLGPRG